jgi:hypothetical protein
MLAMCRNLFSIGPEPVGDQHLVRKNSNRNEARQNLIEQIDVTHV